MIRAIEAKDSPAFRRPPFPVQVLRSEGARLPCLVFGSGESVSFGQRRPPRQAPFLASCRLQDPHLGVPRPEMVRFLGGLLHGLPDRVREDVRREADLRDAQDGLRPLRLHELRHSRASNLLRTGIRFISWRGGSATTRPLRWPPTPRNSRTRRTSFPMVLAEGGFLANEVGSRFLIL